LIWRKLSVSPRIENARCSKQKADRIGRAVREGAMPRWLFALVFAVAVVALPFAMARAAGSSGFPTPGGHYACYTASCAKVSVVATTPASAPRQKMKR
jgi:hypothetical protein